MGSVQKCVEHLHPNFDYQSITWGVPHIFEHAFFMLASALVILPHYLCTFALHKQHL